MKLRTFGNPNKNVVVWKVSAKWAESVRKWQNERIPNFVTCRFLFLPQPEHFYSPVILMAMGLFHGINNNVFSLLFLILVVEWEADVDRQFSTFIHVSIFVISTIFPLLFLLTSCVADNSLGRSKKYIEVSGRPGPAQFTSAPWSKSPESYNLSWKVESYPPLGEVRLLYRKLMVW